MTTRYVPLLTAALTVSILSGSTAFSQEHDGPQPNILVILVDDLGYMDIGANNPSCFYDTPNIDRLARSGMRFTDGYAANPVCSPTRYSLMTGKYPTRARATNWFGGRRHVRFHPAPMNHFMPLDEKTLAELVKQKGYATFFAGKWHLGPTQKYFPQNRGFDINIGGHHAGGPYTGNKYFSPFENPELNPDSPPGDHLPARLARETANFIKTHADKPFLAYLSFYSVHTPLMGRPDLVEKYEKRAAEKTGKVFGKEGENFQHTVRILQNHAVYGAMVEAMDEAVGTVLRQLEASGLNERTLVLFTSDNGGMSTSRNSPTSNMPLRGGKGWIYEGGIREPWLVRYPGVTEPGSVSSETICSIDLYPTVAAAVGVEIEHLIDGINIMPALRGQSLPARPLFWHYPHYSANGGFPGGAIRVGHYKLLERYEDGRVHLYNLKDDIGEQNDLAATEPERVAAMRSRLHSWYKTVDAQFLREKEGRVPWQPASTLNKSKGNE